MAIKENPEQIPKKFRTLKRSFMKSIFVDNNQSFKSFPKNIGFHGKEKDENIVLIIRSHWITLLPSLVLTLLIFVTPLILSAIIPSLVKSILLFMAVLITALIVGIGILINGLIKWYYNVSIITDQRILDLDFPSVMTHVLTETQIDKIEDVTHKQVGALGSIFDIGTVYIQTAGTNQNIEFQNIPRPRDVQDILVDILESKQKGEI